MVTVVVRGTKDKEKAKTRQQDRRERRRRGNRTQVKMDEENLERGREGERQEPEE